MSVLYTFPGQGSQQAGMLSRLPPVKPTDDALRIAREVLGRDPLDMETEASLASTVSAQLALLIAGVATAGALADLGCRPDMVAGMSVGAFPAAVVAGVLRYEDALRLVDMRARLMQQAYPAGYGMVAILGLDESQVRRAVADVHTAGNPVYVANINAERQVVISGADAAMAAVAQRALRAGATHCPRLAVSVPSHCELLCDAAATLRRCLADVSLRPPGVAYLSSSLARAIADPDRIAEDLATNLCREVNWRDTAQLAWERGARLAVEMPSGDVLTRLMIPAFAEGMAVACSANSLETIRALSVRER
ncbi:malonate decarboxylase subunit epsilon [Bordetella genomosp. 8]|uniref:Malonyl CoA-acyl carrier protein transacylase n=1 Tax=Bordetella genomosp. 8 TaxID=1416806 RepID=A0A1W6YNL4_9BORD|nr:malonate decarboxylase subunit epsilon [Bordetella genomosp. 8]ARP82655.1 malonate decarboxylase subunit epsilon [Bordetella genomosp. 8]